MSRVGKRGDRRLADAISKRAWMGWVVSEMMIGRAERKHLQGGPDGTLVDPQRPCLSLTVFLRDRREQFHSPSLPLNPHLPPPPPPPPLQKHPDPPGLNQLLSCVQKLLTLFYCSPPNL